MRRFKREDVLNAARGADFALREVDAGTYKVSEPPIVKEGVVGFRHGTAILETVEHDEHLGEYRMGVGIVPLELRGKRVRVTIEVLEDPS